MRAGLKVMVAEQERLDDALTYLSDLVPGRVSLRQVLFFIKVCTAAAKGTSLSLADLRAVGGDTPEGEARFGYPSVRLFSTFFEPTEAEPNALDWVELEIDPDDARKRYLRLTNEGRKVAETVLSKLASGRPPAKQAAKAPSKTKGRVTA